MAPTSGSLGQSKTLQQHFCTERAAHKRKSLSHSPGQSTIQSLIDDMHRGPVTGRNCEERSNDRPTSRSFGANHYFQSSRGSYIDQDQVDWCGKMSSRTSNTWPIEAIRASRYDLSKIFGQSMPKDASVGRAFLLFYTRSLYLRSDTQSTLTDHDTKL